MSLRRARPLDSLYRAVADYDLVLVPDNPLADAINRRVETAKFGTFATTPRRLATGRREQENERLVFLELVGQTDHSWKAIRYAIENVLQCWKHEGTVDAIFDYPAYVDEAMSEVVEILDDLDSTAGALTRFTIEDHQSVAVVGDDQLSELERSILPAGYDRVDPFTDETFDHPPFHVFDSPAAIVDAVMDTVSPASAGEVAVVLDSASNYSTLVESALETAGVPYYGGPGFADDPDHRAFLGLLRAAFRGSGTTVDDVSPVCAQLGVDIPVEHRHKRLDSVDVPALSWVREFCAATDSYTFGNALHAYEHETGRTLDRLREELQALGLTAQPLTRQRIDDLAYYIQSYEVPVDREDEGVLLADATSSGYVDRPVVFYLGIDEGWTSATPRRPWIDADAQFDRHVRQFQQLLQSGTEQYYLVQDTAGGQPVTPCLYLSELLGEEFDRFSDLDSVRHTRPREGGGGAGGFEKESVGVEPTAIDTISQSSLNTYVNSPREYFFSRLLDSPDRDYFREGTLFHDFAECYVTHPERFDEEAVSAVVEVMLEDADGFFHGDDEPLRRRKYRIGLETIVEYLEANQPETDDFLTPSAGWGTNTIAEHFDVIIDSPLTEHWFENVAIGAKGLIDLVRAPDHLVDYKSGSKKSAYSVVKGTAVDPPDDTPNFQAALYLSHFRTEQPNQRIEFTFFHFLETLDDVVAGDASLEDTLTTVTYYPETFAEFVTSRETYETLLNGYSDCVETFEDLGFTAYVDIMDDCSFPETTDRDELRESTFAEEFTAAVDAATADQVDAEKGTDQAIRALNGVRKRAFFREGLDAFEQFVTARIEEINRRRAGRERFPVDGPAGEPNYRRVDHRDLLLDGKRDTSVPAGESDD